MATTEETKPAVESQPSGAAVGTQKVIFVRTVPFPIWAKKALDKSIESALKRYGHPVK